MIRVKGDPLEWVKLSPKKPIELKMSDLRGVTKLGRPKRYETPAAKQKAYRERRKAG